MSVAQASATKASKIMVQRAVPPRWRAKKIACGVRPILIVVHKAGQNDEQQHGTELCLLSSGAR